MKNLHGANSNRGGKSSARYSNVNLPKVHDNLSDIEFDVRCSYLEIYNEMIMDLLDTNLPKL